ncbi:MAG: hypothetical protein BMS9Abin29_0856 [Gemmatimonadota bacterium]|nr:MAG: hypothetical protein BMS9Abin29_0856 [Gemmatimonadota bacterium]
MRTDTAGLFKRIPALLPPGSKPATSAEVKRLYSVIGGGPGERPGVRRYSMLYANTVQVARTMNLGEILAILESELALYVAERAYRRIFVHAGVVGWRGKAILVPGSTMSGKTSLVAALLRAGATYYSDEYAVLDERGSVHPFPRPLSIREEEGALSTKRPAADFGARTGSKPIPIGLVAVTKYKEGATFKPRRQSDGRAVLELLAHTVPARREPRRVFTTLSRAVSGVPVLKGARGEADRVAIALIKRLDAHG